MSDGLSFPISLYLSKDKLSSMPADVLSGFLQVLRIDNAIRSPMKLHAKLAENPDGIENTKDRIDLMLQMAAAYYEGLRTFADKLYPRLNALRYLPPDLVEWFEGLKRRLLDRGNDYFLTTCAVIRDKIVGHFDHDVIFSNISDGVATQKLLFAYLRDPSVSGFIPVEPYSMIALYLSKMLPPDVPREDTWTWINATAFKEADSFCRFLEHFLGAFAAANGERETGVPWGDGLVPPRSS